MPSPSPPPPPPPESSPPPPPPPEAAAVTRIVILNGPMPQTEDEAQEALLRDTMLDTKCMEAPTKPAGLLLRRTFASAAPEQNVFTIFGEPVVIYSMEEALATVNNGEKSDLLKALLEVFHGEKANSFSHLSRSNNADKGAAALWRRLCALGAVLRAEPRKYVARLEAAFQDLRSGGVQSIFPSISPKAAALIDGRLQALEEEMAAVTERLQDLSGRVDDVEGTAAEALREGQRANAQVDELRKYCVRRIEESAKEIQNGERRRSEENRRRSGENRELRKAERVEREEADAAAAAALAEERAARATADEAEAAQRLTDTVHLSTTAFEHGRQLAGHGAALGGLYGLQHETAAALEAERAERASADAAAAAALVEERAARESGDGVAAAAVAHEVSLRAAADEAEAVRREAGDLASSRLSRAVLLGAQAMQSVLVGDDLAGPSAGADAPPASAGSVRGGKSQRSPGLGLYDENMRRRM